jgi:adenine-specific DNA methylase
MNMSTHQLLLFDDLVDVEDEEAKRCPDCGELKPLSYFYRRARNPDGYGRKCANCENPDRQTTGPVRRVSHPRMKSKRVELSSGHRQCLSEQGMRRKVIARDRVCRVCGRKRRLEVHHILPDGELTDNLDYLTCLCTHCHALVHSMKPVETRSPR